MRKKKKKKKKNKVTDSNMQEAFDFVVSKRPCVQPNPGLWEQLETFEKRLREDTEEN